MKILYNHRDNYDKEVKARAVQKSRYGPVQGRNKKPDQQPYVPPVTRKPPPNGVYCDLQGSYFTFNIWGIHGGCCEIQLLIHCDWLLRQLESS